MRFIGISGAAGAGKSTAGAFLASALVDLGLTVRLDAFAVPIKESMRRIRGWDGSKDAAAREVMQRIGSDMRADAPDCFIRDLGRRNGLCLVRDAVGGDRSPAGGPSRTGGRSPAGGLIVLADAFAEGVPDFIVVTDVRFPNEAAFLRRRGVLIHVDGGGNLPPDLAEHESESHLGELRRLADRIIPPAPDLRSLENAVRALVIEGGHVKPKGNEE